MAGRRWIGRAMIAIATIHTLFGLAVFGGTVSDIVSAGLFNSIGEDPMRGAVVWFLMSGFFMATTGLAVDSMEANGLGGNLASTGWTLLIISIVGIVLMPVSGFWLMLVPAISAIRAKGHGA